MRAPICSVLLFCAASSPVFANNDLAKHCVVFDTMDGYYLEYTNNCDFPIRTTFCEDDPSTGNAHSCTHYAIGGKNTAMPIGPGERSGVSRLNSEVEFIYSACRAPKFPVVQSDIHRYSCED